MSRPKVREHTRSRLAVGTFVLVLLLQAGVLTFSALHGWEGDSYMLAIAVIWGIVGVVLAARRPTNWIGWLFLLAVLSWSVSGAAGHYAKYALVTAPGSLPGGTFAYWLMTWTWLPGFVLLPTFALLLFPDGGLPSRRWRPVGILAVVACAAGVAWFWLVPWQDSDEFPWAPPAVENPLHGSVPEVVHGALFAVFAILVIGTILAGVTALVLRYRRAQDGERQQLKWAVLGGVVSVAVYLTGDVTTRLPGIDWWLVGFVALTVFPLTVALAILRYRLYDIDRVVSRTVSYGLLTAVLVGVYAAGVVGFGGLVRSMTRGDGGDLVVAASTLAAAALFGPARRRIQAAVDRRFDRTRYDAHRTIEEFAKGLRDEVDLVVLSMRLERTVSATMEPRNTSLWLQTGAVDR